MSNVREFPIITPSQSSLNFWRDVINASLKHEADEHYCKRRLEDLSYIDNATEKKQKPNPSTSGSSSDVDKANIPLSEITSYKDDTAAPMEYSTTEEKSTEPVKEKPIEVAKDESIETDNVSAPAEDIQNTGLPATNIQVIPVTNATQATDVLSAIELSSHKTLPILSYRTMAYYSRDKEFKTFSEAYEEFRKNDNVWCISWYRGSEHFRWRPKKKINKWHDRSEAKLESLNIAYQYSSKMSERIFWVRQELVSPIIQQIVNTPGITEAEIETANNVTSILELMTETEFINKFS